MCEYNNLFKVIPKTIVPPSPPIKVKEEPIDEEEQMQEDVEEFESYDFGQLDIEVNILKC